VEPAEASRYVVNHSEGNDWLPGPLEAEAPLPLSGAEVHELYRTNVELSPEEDAEIAGTLPDLTSLPTPAGFSALVAALAFVEPEELATYWERAASEDATRELERLSDLVRDAARELDRMEPWQRSVVAAGHAGGAERELWIDLSKQIEAGFDQWEESRALLLEHEVSISPELWAEGAPSAAEELSAHVGNGGSLGYWSLIGKPAWKKVLEGCTVEGRKPSTPEHFQAIAARLRLGEGRRRLQTRWIKQASPIGMPKFEALGDSPERVLPEYGEQVDSLLDWWTDRWTVIEEALRDCGFRWGQFRSREVARSAPLPPFERDASILGGPLLEAVSSRREAAKRAAAVRRLGEAEELLVHCPGEVSAAVKAAVRSRNVVQYERALSALIELSKKEQIWKRRRELIDRLAASAPEWANAVLQREGPHAAGLPPGDPTTAWRWRQLQQEILRRAKLDEVALGRRLRQRQTSLRETTTQLIERLAWLGQLRRTDLNSRIALEGWSQTVRKVGKGTGKRVPQLQARARGLLIEARDAVPVWIMPLSRVAESFDPAQRKFDVVIIDESSQSDVTGLLAWYLGEQIAVVGDHEQVSPLGVGEEVEGTTNLIAQYLTDIPNSHLYDGRTSVYDLARTCFGGAIALREHFRCVPDIIGFSDELSYNSEIRPLRAPRSAPRPHVVEYVVDAGRADHSGKTNLAEARAVVALLKAATELREYRAKSLGAITLLGDEQAGLIQDLAVRLIGPVELDRRRFLAGNSAQFQGDERDIVFLSMVDTSGVGPLHLRHTDAFKQRYNVAASRARDQLWLVHSLDPVRDLKEGDLRRRLIEYVRDPGGRRRARELVARRAESPFERTVAERLIAAGYRVSSQVTIGSYRIDLVVSDESSEAAIECDGDRYHGLDDISNDMARQAVLERAGWRFIRIRGTRFFRDPDKTMEWVIDELERLGVGPAGFESEASNPEAIGAELRERVIQRAFEIMRQQSWVQPAADA
jgi:very-short-patch-repair endonuclease